MPIDTALKKKKETLAPETTKTTTTGTTPTQNNVQANVSKATTGAAPAASNPNPGVNINAAIVEHQKQQAAQAATHAASKQDLLTKPVLYEPAAGSNSVAINNGWVKPQATGAINSTPEVAVTTAQDNANDIAAQNGWTTPTVNTAPASESKPQYTDKFMHDMGVALGKIPADGGTTTVEDNADLTASQSAAEDNAPQQPAGSAYSNTANNLAAQLESLYTSAGDRSSNKIDYATSQSISDLNRALEESNAAYRAQKNEANIEEAQALDNQALASAAKGDRGGIGQAQYSYIQAQAQARRQEINSAQQKLASDTSRQIADLRAQGEYEKADALLELTQSKLSQLMDIQKWATEGEISDQQYQDSLNQWYLNYELEKQSMLDSEQQYQDTKRRQEAQDSQSNMAFYKAWVDDAVANGASLKDIPEEYISGAGYSNSLVQSMIDKRIADEYAAAYKSSKSTTDKSQETSTDNVQELFTAASKSVDPASYIRLNVKSYGITDAATVSKLIKSYEEWAAGNTGSSAASASTNIVDYESAVDYMLEQGVDNGTASSAMTKREWQRHKATGSASDEVTYYNTYEDYLNAYIQYAIENK